MAMQEHDNVLAHANLYRLRWTPLNEDMRNAVQVLLPTPFDHMSIEWSRSFCFQGGYKGGDAIGNIAYILWSCIDGFKKGGECHLDVECMLVRKVVCKHTTLLRPQPTSFNKSIV